MRRERVGRRWWEPERGRTWRGTRPWRGLVATVIVLLLPSILADPAQGGTYVMRNCDVPGRASASLGPWGTAEMQPNARLVDACATAYIRWLRDNRIAK